MSMMPQPLYLHSFLADNTVTIINKLTNYLSLTLARPVYHDQEFSSDERLSYLETSSDALSWVCGLLYLQLQERGVALTPVAAPVMHAYDYQQNVSIPCTHPLYFSYLIVPRHSAYQTLTDLHDARLVINETGSFSGHHILRQQLARSQPRRNQPWFSKVMLSGGHKRSVAVVSQGKADAAVIDSTAFDAWANTQPQLLEQVRVLHTIGPFPMPPWVVSAHMDKHTQKQIRRVLLQAPSALLAPLQIKHFTAVDDAYYQSIRTAIKRSNQVTITPYDDQILPYEMV